MAYIIYTARADGLAVGAIVPTQLDQFPFIFGAKINQLLQNNPRVCNSFNFRNSGSKILLIVGGEMMTTRCSKRRRVNQGDPEVERGEKRSPQGGDDKHSKSAENEIGKMSPVVVFAHGAAAPSSSDWMIRWKDMLANELSAIEVITFDYPYISGGKRRAPPRAEKLVDFHSDITRKAMEKYPGHPLVLAGKSMGSRISCMFAGEKDSTASAVVCLGYPLKGTNGAVRDETLLQLRVPVMFVQGSKDGLCPLEQLEAVRKKMKSINELHVIQGGDHSFKIAKKHLQSTGSDQEKAERLAVQAVAKFVSYQLKKNRPNSV